MELNNLEQLKNAIDNNETVTINNISFIPLILERRHEMRLDNVSFELYETNKYVTEIAFLNGITNVFSVKEGEVILAPDPEFIDSVFSFKASVIEAIKEAVIAANSKRKGTIDKNRLASKSNRSQVEQDKKLPPTIVNNDKFTVENGNLILKTNF